MFEVTFALDNQNCKRNQTILHFLLYLCLKYLIFLIGWLLKFIYSGSLHVLLFLIIPFQIGSFNLWTDF